MSDIAKQSITRAAQVLSEFHQFDACDQAIQLITNSQGPLIIAGIGKSGHIAAKLASTFRSLGREAHFIHAAEASHGDLGCFTPNAVVMILSNSGETSELSDIVNFCKSRGNPMITITANTTSTIARAATVTIAYGDVDEADKNGLAPTTSTTLTLAIGDAIAVGYADAMNFMPADFAHFHPRGRLGARLQTAAEIMRSGDDLPTVAHNANMQEAVFALSQKNLGLVVLMNGINVAGILTDGDLRRNIDGLWDKSPASIATTSPKFIASNMLIGDAIGYMSKLGITQLLVRDGNHFCGILHMHDCMRA